VAAAAAAAAKTQGELVIQDPLFEAPPLKAGVLEIFG
jgi:hypothetical protein